MRRKSAVWVSVVGLFATCILAMQPERDKRAVLRWYRLPKGKTEAFAEFLRHHVGPVTYADADVQRNVVIIKATENVHEAIAPFIRLMREKGEPERFLRPLRRGPIIDDPSMPINRLKEHLRSLQFTRDQTGRILKGR